MLRYCRAYPVDELRRFEPLDRRLTEMAEPPGDGVLFVWDDLGVTVSTRPGESLIDPGTEHWRVFCEQELGFTVPQDVLAAGHG
jgi:hypothetical protein